MMTLLVVAQLTITLSATPASTTVPELTDDGVTTTDPVEAVPDNPDVVEPTVPDGTPCVPGCPYVEMHP